MRDSLSVLHQSGDGRSLNELACTRQQIRSRRKLNRLRSRFGAAALLSSGQMGAATIVRNNEYDPFAKIYNRYWGEDYRAEAFPVVEGLLLARIKSRASLLDVC